MAYYVMCTQDELGGTYEHPRCYAEFEDFAVARREAAELGPTAYVQDEDGSTYHEDLGVGGWIAPRDETMD